MAIMGEVTTQMLDRALEVVGESPISLRWEPAPYSNGKSMVADLSLPVQHVKILCADAVRSEGFRYHVRRSSPRSRLWLAKRNGDFFDKAYYSSKEAAMKACEEDAKSPKTRLKDRKHEVLA